jgi:transaldolase
MTTVDRLKVQIFADGADKAGMLEMYAKPFVKGFTTNPTLMRKVGVTDYEAFAKDILGVIPDRPISFEVFADDFAEMERQARRICTWGTSVFVKIPITNTKGESSIPLIKRLSAANIQLNITAILTVKQVRETVDALNPNIPAIVSVFAGRIADTGRDPMPLMKECAAITKQKPKAQLLWASPRELLNIFHAEECGCQIITVTSDILKKLAGVGKPLEELSLDTVKMFYNDASAAGFKL